MENSNTNKKRIFVMEDEPAITSVFERVIKGMGFMVDTAANGNIAKDVLGKNDYDLIILDIRTPYMMGDELYIWLRGKYPEKADRVIFTSGDTMSGNTRSFLEQSQRPFLPTPFTPSELRIIIVETLRQNK